MGWVGGREGGRGGLFEVLLVDGLDGWMDGWMDAGWPIPILRKGKGSGGGGGGCCLSGDVDGGEKKKRERIPISGIFLALQG